MNTGEKLQQNDSKIHLLTHKGILHHEWVGIVTVMHIWFNIGKSNNVIYLLINGNNHDYLNRRRKST